MFHIKSYKLNKNFFSLEVGGLTFNSHWIKCDYVDGNGFNRTNVRFVVTLLQVSIKVALV